MNIAADLYRSELAHLTDLYQLTMAYGYWKTGRAEEEAVFHLFFRKNPFKGGYTVACGLSHIIDYLQGLRFDATDLEYLGTLTGNDGKALFDREFLEYLGRMEFRLDIDAIPEGTVVFAQEPLVRVKGPLLACQLVETPFLNMVNFQTLIATKAASRSWSSACAAPRGSTAAWRPRARPTSAAVRQRPTFSPANCSASPSRGRMPTAGS